DQGPDLPIVRVRTQDLMEGFHQLRQQVFVKPEPLPVIELGGLPVALRKIERRKPGIRVECFNISPETFKNPIGEGLSSLWHRKFGSKGEKLLFSGVLQFIFSQKILIF